MPRTARIIIPNHPHHVIQRGHNRQTVFASDDDYRYYLANLQEWKKRLGCKVYAYCLMTNHVHLVLDPGDRPENIALLMKRVAGRQTRYVNKLEQRSGTLWEGRYKSSPISTDNYLLACCRYVEMNPVRAGMVDVPEAYQWSSCAFKVGLREEEWLDLDPCYAELGNTVEMQQDSYCAWLAESVCDEEMLLIRTATQQGKLIGAEAFVTEVSERLGRRCDLRSPGRPRGN